MENETSSASDRNNMQTMDPETERVVSDIKDALIRMEGKIDALKDSVLPTLAAMNERVKALEAIVRWQWGVIGMVIAAFIGQVIHSWPK